MTPLKTPGVVISSLNNPDHSPPAPSSTAGPQTAHRLRIKPAAKHLPWCVDFIKTSTTSQSLGITNRNAVHLNIPSQEQQPWLGSKKKTAYRKLVSAVCLHTYCSLLDEGLHAIPKRTQIKDLTQRTGSNSSKDHRITERHSREVPHTPLMVLLRAFRTVTVLSVAESSPESLHQGNQ